MLITDKNDEQVAVEGCLRSTVKETYDQIISDIDEAIRLLSESGVNPEQILDSKPKRLVSLATAYGIRARVNLVMNKWGDAAADAEAAIKNFKGAPMSQATASVPGLTSLNETNWMWGIAIAETYAATGFLIQTATAQASAIPRQPIAHPTTCRATLR